ncbi:hypothetical protein E2F47_22715 [Mycobacterium eburneum]|nr:hypothetical protein [Mycobacterium eburneum]TDH48712.1 hypothetical protein E2F47_22715 [Mycobacterium eburneum]
MTNFEFIEGEPPPPDHGRNAMYRAFADALRARPGDWAKWPREPKDANNARTLASNLNAGRLTTFATGFEGRASGATVYARYVGSES